MSIRVTVTCDAPTCLAEVDLYSLRNASDAGIAGLGWIVQLSAIRSSIAGGTLEVTRHYCCDACAAAGNAAQRALDARELVRR